MKTAADLTAPAAGEGVAPIVRLVDGDDSGGDPAGLPAGDAGQDLERARAFAEPLLAAAALDTGENTLAHADGVAAILRRIGAAPAMCAAAYLVYAGDHLQRPEEVVAKAFGASHASLVTLTRKLVQIQRSAREADLSDAGDAQRAQQLERVRKMLLAFSRDLRVVLLRLASRLQTLRWYAASRTPCPRPLAEESMQVFAPLANRLGIWQIKWEIEDLAFRFLEPADYQALARSLHETRLGRERVVAAARDALAALLARPGGRGDPPIEAEVQGRPKHLYSIWKKMRGKSLDLERVFDIRALRVIVADVPACYAALARVQQRWRSVEGEFDDYIARPKPNGYQSLHCVVLADDGRPVEIQIRTRAMHEHAEHGVAAHWMYKEAGVRGYAGVSASGAANERVAEARKAVLRQLLAWEREVGESATTGAGAGSASDERIYVFTPQATVIELPAGATPIDFAYAVHSDLGHRCRGARVDGALVPLNTSLQHGQTVEVVTAKEGGPSLDWLNGDLGYIKSPRSRAKVRAWFNAQALQATIAKGREAVERLLQREGRTAIKLDSLAEQLGFKQADDLFEVVGKDEFSLRTIENLLKPAAPEAADEGITLRRSKSDGRGGVLVVGVESLMTTLARCCRPAPPDAIGGFVTRGKGVAIHRADCSNFRHMAQGHAERVVAVAWGETPATQDAGRLYPLDVQIEATDRSGLLRDVSEVFVKEKINVTGVHTQNHRRGQEVMARMTFTVEAPDTSRLTQALAQIARVPGVRMARRK